ncbi:hypothetical protein Hanom_Chr11g01026121 [Helianthus anomalus]
MDNTQKKTSSVFQGSKVSTSSSSTNTNNDISVLFSQIKSYVEQHDKTNQMILQEIDDINKQKRPAEDHSPLVPRMLDFVTPANAAQQSGMPNTQPQGSPISQHGSLEMTLPQGSSIHQPGSLAMTLPQGSSIHHHGAVTTANIKDSSSGLKDTWRHFQPKDPTSTIKDLLITHPDLQCRLTLVLMYFRINDP